MKSDLVKSEVYRGLKKSKLILTSVLVRIGENSFSPVCMTLYESVADKVYQRLLNMGYSAADLRVHCYNLLVSQ